VFVLYCIESGLAVNNEVKAALRCSSRLHLGRVRKAINTLVIGSGLWTEIWTWDHWMYSRSTSR